VDFFTAGPYLNAPAPSRALYVAGLKNTLNALTDTGNINSTWAVTFIKGKHSTELTAMFDLG